MAKSERSEAGWRTASIFHRASRRSPDWPGTRSGRNYSPSERPRQIIPETMAIKTQSPPITPSTGIAKPKPTAIAAAQTRPLPIADRLICAPLPYRRWLDAKARALEASGASSSGAISASFTGVRGSARWKTLGSEGRGSMSLARPNREPDARQTLRPSLDDLNDLARAGVNEDGPIVDYGVTILLHSIFGRDVIIVPAVGREQRAGSHLVRISVGRSVFARDIVAKARTLIDAEKAVDAADHPADHPADNGADGTRVMISLVGAVLCS